MIAHDHQRVRSVAGIDAAGGVGQHNGAYSHASQHAHWECDLLRRVAFVEMRAALHHGQRKVVESAEDEPARVSEGRAPGKVGNAFVGDGRGVVQFVGEGAEAGAEHDADTRPQRSVRQNKLRRLVGGSELVSGSSGVHGNTFPFIGVPSATLGAGSSTPAVKSDRLRSG